MIVCCYNTKTSLPINMHLIVNILHDEPKYYIMRLVMLNFMPFFIIMAVPLVKYLANCIE